MTLTMASSLLESRCASMFRCLNHSFPSQSLQREQRRSVTKMVRVILKEDMPNGKGYAGDVVKVKAGYARNLLIPRKVALYAVPANFERLGMKDPDAETVEEKRARLQQEEEAEAEGGEDMKAAEKLRYYLRNKVLKIWRNVDANTGQVHPGYVTAKNVRDKLGRQLKIDLEDHELVHLKDSPTSTTEELTDEALDKLIEDIPTQERCPVKIKQLGEFVAKLSLAGGYTVPLKFVVLKR
mmetsp:Transcript_16556/g.23354  ORF Transcript_16556/g.23354 Transcript_16556/m.23354 type:complete len:239 (+) Transcript_16556:26-742(+)